MQVTWHCVFIFYQVTCFDWDADGSHDVIGHFSTSLAELVSAHSSHKKLEWECVNPEKAKKKKKYKNSGTVHAEVKVRLNILLIFSFVPAWLFVSELDSKYVCVYSLIVHVNSCL